MTCDGHIFAFLTASRVRWPNPKADAYEEEIGWVDPWWGRRVLHNSRNDVRPVVDESEDSPDLQDYVREALDEYLGAYEDNGDGTFYACDPKQPIDEDWSYSYALHFIRKSHDSKRGWYEDPYRPEGV